VISSDPTKAAEELEKWAAGLEKKARGYTELQNRLDETSVTADARDGAIRVTVDANGVPIGLELAERTRELAAAQLSAEILGCMRQAQARLRERVRDLVADTVPVDDDPARNLMTQYEQRFPGVVDDHTGEDDDRIGELPEEHARHEEPPHRSVTQDTAGPDDEWDDQSPLRG
jgi:DNA-binding protein YbaB